MVITINKKIDQEKFSLERNMWQLNAIKSKIQKAEQRILELEEIRKTFPDAVISDYPIRNQIVDPSVQANKRYISRAIQRDSISYSEYADHFVGNKKIRIYKSTQKIICTFKKSYQPNYTYRATITNLPKSSMTIFESDIWNDVDCKKKIKSIYKRFIKGIKSQDEITFEGLKYAPDYIKMLSNFK